MERYTLAFDIDGTIINKRGEVDDGVMALFNKADLNNTTFIFLTSGTYKTAQVALKRINEQLKNKTGTQIKGYVAANCGADIYSPDGVQVVNRYFTTPEILSITKKARKTDPCCAIIYVTDDAYYCEDQTYISRRHPQRYVSNQLKLNLYKKQEAKKGEFGASILSCRKFVSAKDVDEFVSLKGNIRSLYISTYVFREKTRDRLLSNVQSANKEATLCPSKIVSTMHKDSKLGALQYILKVENTNPKFASDTANVVYFGDGVSDIPVLNACNLSVARAKKPKAKVAAAAKMAMEDCTAFADDLFAGKYDEMIMGKESTNTPTI